MPTPKCLPKPIQRRALWLLAGCDSARAVPKAVERGASWVG
jgi:hypothetical protein